MQQCTVDNRVFLLGLDALYREALKRHERSDLLTCARTVATALRVQIAEIPVEGYYAEDESLREYFWRLRALQATDASRVPEVATQPAYLRLKEITASPLFGAARDEGRLLPLARDCLTTALDKTTTWTVPALTAAAAAEVRVRDDCSLVGLAARAQDAVVLTALRESVVLYASRAIFSKSPPRGFLWAVDRDLAKAAQRFIDTFNDLFEEELPAANSTHVEQYWDAHDVSQIVGRCVCLGHDRNRPPRYYHWALCCDQGGQLTVRDFWVEEVWTTAAFRSALTSGGDCPEHLRHAVPKDPDAYGDIFS